MKFSKLLPQMAAVVILAAVIPLQAATKRPNLIFVCSDQHSADMMGAYGSPDVQTPNLDRLARAGVRFTNGISNSPVCTPFRGILLSGQHVLNNGAIQNDLQILPGNGTYLPEILRDSGYHMGYYGKWHLYGGDRVRGIPAGPYRYGFDDEFISNNCTLVFDAARAYYWDQSGEHRKLYGDWEPYAQTRQAIEFVDHHANGDAPFAMFLSWHPPHNWGVAHSGYNAPQDLLDLYDPAKLTLRPTVKDTPRTREMYQGHMAAITGLDRAFGWLMDALEKKGIADNTIVVFTADHGDLLMSYDWPSNKGRVEAGSSRVPLIMSWPDRLKPDVNDMLLGTLDLMPTLLGLMDLPVPETCQGHDSSLAIIEGRDNGIEAQPMFFFPLNWRGVFTKRYTYSESLHNPSAGEGVAGKQIFNVLYDRQEDPWETRNLFGTPEAAALQSQLHTRTHQLMARFGDTGLSCTEILERVVRPEDLQAIMTPPAKRPKGWEGRLRGRPVDILNGKPAIQPHTSTPLAKNFP